MFCSSRSDEVSQETLSIDVSTAEDCGAVGVLAIADRPRPVRTMSDAHAGLMAAIGATPPGAARQRSACTTPTITSTASWPWVRNLLHSVFDQSDPDSVAAQHDQIIAALSDKLPNVAVYLEGARPDLLAFHRVPEEIWSPPRATQQRDPPAHRHRRNLPRPHLAIRLLVGVVLAEQHDEWAESRR